MKRLAALFVILVTSRASAQVTVSGVGAVKGTAVLQVGAPVISLSVSSLNFPNTAQGSSSSSLPVTVTNTGNTQLSITSITISPSGPNQSYSQTNNCPVALAASANCTINVTFTPTTTGTILRTLAVNGNSANSPQTVSLSGIGTLVSGTVLAQQAAAMSPLTWTHVTALEVSSWQSGALFNTPGDPSGNGTTWSNRVMWNGPTREAYFMGGGHCGAGSGCANDNVFFKYVDATNAWSAISPASTAGDGHSYYHQTVNPSVGTSGKIYHREYNSNTVDVWDVASQAFGSALPSIGQSSLQCCNALEYFPDRNSLIEIDGDNGIFEYTYSNNQWNCLNGTNLAPCGTTHPMGSIYVFAHYDVVSHALWFGGGGSNVYAMAANGTITTQATAPCGIGSNTAESVVTVDPQTGNLVAFCGSTYSTLANGGSWTSQGTSPFTSSATSGLVCGPIADYGIVMCLNAGQQTGNVSTGQVWIWKSKTFVANNFQNRINGVNVPGGFASIVSSQNFEPASSVPTCASPFPCESGGNGSQFYTHHFSAGTPSQDCTVSADGSCALKFTIANGSFQGDAGWYDYNFSPSFTSGTGQFGAGQEFFIQYKIRIDPALLGGGAISADQGQKHDITTEGDILTKRAGDCSNSPGEVVSISDPTAAFQGPWVYNNCAFSGGALNFMQSGYQPIQLGGVASSNFLDQDAAGCPHYSGRGIAVSDPTCFIYVGNEWFTIQKHIKVGAFGTASSVIEQWVAHANAPSYLTTNASDAAIVNDGSGGASGKYGKIQLSTYDTGATFNVNSAVWFDDLIVSTRRIPDPDVANPNAPDSLSLAVTTGRITVSWRVNSQNGTLQDDTGILVERCTGNAAACFPNGQSGFAQIGTTTAGASSFADNTVVSGTTYTYRVRANNATGSSAYAAAICFNGGTTCGGTAVAQ